jgi:hypothetical protein
MLFIFEKQRTHHHHYIIWNLFVHRDFKEAAMEEVYAVHSALGVLVLVPQGVVRENGRLRELFQIV